jgi:hypothetical protein
VTHDAVGASSEPLWHVVVVSLIWLAFFVFATIQLGAFAAGYVGGAAVGWVMCSISLRSDWRWWRDADERRAVDRNYPHSWEFNGGPVCWCGVNHPKPDLSKGVWVSATEAHLDELYLEAWLGDE